MKRLIRLINPQQAHTALADLWLTVKPYLLAGHTLRVLVTEDRRTRSQNDFFHALCEDLEKSKLPWAGKQRTAEQWKVLLISGHSVATKEGAEMVPGLEGEFVNVRESSARMSKSRGSSLISYTLAFCANNGVPTTKDDT